MKIRSGLGIVLLSALAASCTSSHDKSLERIANGTPVVGKQAPETAQDSISQKDESNKKRLAELASLYPSPNMVPVYVGDFDVFLEQKVLEREAEVAKNFSKPDYWKKEIEKFDRDSSNYSPYRSRDITTREKLEKIVADPKARQELERAIMGEEGGHVHLDMWDIINGEGPSPTTFPVGFLNFEFYGNRDNPVVFYFRRSAFEKRKVFENDDVNFFSGKLADITPQTNSLASYMFAKIYAEQLADGKLAGRLSAAELKSLYELGAIVDRRSALIETYDYFWQMTGIQSPESKYVGIVLSNSNRAYGKNN